MIPATTASVPLTQSVSHDGSQVPHRPWAQAQQIATPNSVLLHHGLNSTQDRRQVYKGTGLLDSCGFYYWSHLTTVRGKS